jgi:hypothetical protein
MKNSIYPRALALALAIAPALLPAEPHSRVRVINTSTADLLSAKVEDKTIATLVPGFETHHFKKALNFGNYTAHFFTGAGTEFLSDTFHANTGSDTTLIPVVKDGVPDLLALGLDHYKKSKDEGGTMLLSCTVPDGPLMQVFMDEEPTGFLSFKSGVFLQSIPPGTHTFRFFDYKAKVNVFTGTGEITRGNNIVLFTGTVNANDQQPLEIHSYDDHAKF